MPDLYCTAREETLHRHAMQQLAAETGHAQGLVKAVWEHELAALAVDARIRDYLPIFTLRKARAALASLPPASAVVARTAAPVGAMPAQATPARRSPLRRWHQAAGRGPGAEPREVRV